MQSSSARATEKKASTRGAKNRAANNVITAAGDDVAHVAEPIGSASDVTLIKPDNPPLPNRKVSRHRPASTPKKSGSPSDRPPTEGAKINARPAATVVPQPSKLIYSEIGECLHSREDKNSPNQKGGKWTGSRCFNPPNLKKIPEDKNNLEKKFFLDESFNITTNEFLKSIPFDPVGSSTNPILVPSSTALPIRTEDEVNRLISGLRKRCEESAEMCVAPPASQIPLLLETEKKKEVHSESSNSVTKDNSKTIESNVTENTEIITETISNPEKAKSVEKRTSKTSKVDSSTIKDTNFIQTIVRKSQIEVLTETKFADRYIPDGLK